MDDQLVSSHLAHSNKRKPHKVVIVDDDEDLLKLLLFTFDAEGFDVYGMTNGKEAISYLSNDQNLESISLLILDRLLPDMDGLEILQQFAEKFKHRVPVLILSVLSAEKDVIHGLKQGAVDYIPKPFNFPILMEKVLALIARET
jgi:DNA-binding response OmpR family regulator